MAPNNDPTLNMVCFLFALLVFNNDPTFLFDPNDKSSIHNFFSYKLITFLLMHVFPFAVPPVCPAAGAQTLGPVCYPRSESYSLILYDTGTVPVPS